MGCCCDSGVDGVGVDGGVVTVGGVVAVCGVVDDGCDVAARGVCDVDVVSVGVGGVITRVVVGADGSSGVVVICVCCWWVC